MKKFHAFTGDQYYPMAYLGDYLGRYETFLEAVNAAMTTGNDWWCVCGHTEDGSLKVLDTDWAE